MKVRGSILVSLLLALTLPAWGRVLVHWSSSTLPRAHELELADLVISWNDHARSLAKEASKQGYRVYIEVDLHAADAAAKKASEDGLAGIILSVPQTQYSELERALPGLKAEYPKITFLVLNRDGKLPQIRGSMVVKRDAVLEVSSPTAQPWVDSNLSLIRIEERANQQQTPLYTFSWGLSDVGHHETKLTSTDYALAVAEAGAFHADLLLDLDEGLQAGLNAHDPSAWELWKEALNYADFYSREETPHTLEPAANLAVVMADLDPSDEVMNLMARHNIPFKVFRATDLKSNSFESFDVIIVFAKPDQDAAQRIVDLASSGKIIVLIEAQGTYPWQKSKGVSVNEHTTSYDLAGGKVLELSEAVTDPETFSRDILRLLGREHTLIRLWNGLTTIAVPYGPNGRDVREVELINYAADPVRVQVQVKGSFSSVQYESPDHACCESLSPVQHNGFTEFVIPDLYIAGRVHLGPANAGASQ
jgi:protein-tyrosine-phosphatase